MKGGQAEGLGTLINSLGLVGGKGIQGSISCPRFFEFLIPLCDSLVSDLGLREFFL